MRRPALTLLASAVITCATPCPAHAQETWLEVKSPHFTVVANTGERPARDVAWQFEQFRGAIEAGWPWARVRLDRPVVILALKDEASMRRLLPGYWSRGVQPTSLLASTPERHYVAIRTDLRLENTATMNPYRSAYWSYSLLVLNAAFEGNLPLWFRIGLAEVLSNTIVRDSEISFGLPLPQHIQSLAESRLQLRELLTMDASASYFRDDATRGRFDALAWSVVHYMLFGRPEERADSVNVLARLLQEGKPSVDAVAQAFGSLQALEEGYLRYRQQQIFTFSKMKVEETSVGKNFPSERMAPIASAAVRASFHAATDRPEEARALVADIRKTAPESPLVYEVEGLLHEIDGNAAAARTAFEKAVELKSSSRHAHYRLATMMLGPEPDQATLGAIEPLLARTIALDPTYVPAYTLLADVMTRTSRAEEAIGMATKAMGIAPRDAAPRLALARALWQTPRRDMARVHALGARELARTDAQRAAAQQLLEFFDRSTIK
jgi:tetratricopeptide (TPR) repeat protein